MILKRKLYSEAGKKKLEERARKKANKRLYQIQQGREATPGFHRTPVDWLENKSNKEVLDILEKSPKPNRSRRHLFGPLSKSYYKELSDSQFDEMDKAECTLRAGRGSLADQRSGLSDIAKLNKQPVDELMENINIDREEYPHGLRYTDRFEKELKARKDRLKKIEEEKAKEIAKAARKAKIRAWVIGGSLAAAGTVAGVKAIKKKKSKKEDK